MADLTVPRDLTRDLLVALLVVAGVVGIRAIDSGSGDLEDLERVNARTGLSIGPAIPWFAAGMNGDGAAFAVIGADPLGLDAGHSLRNPAFRYTRMGYGWLGSLIATGQERLTLLGLSLIGLVSLGVSVVVALRLSQVRGLVAFAIAANPALLVGVLSDTAEPMAVALLALALLGGSWSASIGLAVARPSYVLALGQQWLLLGAALFTAIAVRVYWTAHFGEAFLIGGFNLDLPFRGIVQSPSGPSLLIVVSGLVTLVVGMVHRNWGWVFAGFLVVCLGRAVVDSPVNAVRAAGLLPVLWAFGPEWVPGMPVVAPTLRGDVRASQDL